MYIKQIQLNNQGNWIEIIYKITRICVQTIVVEIIKSNTLLGKRFFNTALFMFLRMALSPWILFAASKMDIGRRCLVQYPANPTSDGRGESLRCSRRCGMLIQTSSSTFKMCEAWKQWRDAHWSPRRVLKIHVDNYDTRISGLLQLGHCHHHLPVSHVI